MGISERQAFSIQRTYYPDDSHSDRDSILYAGTVMLPILIVNYPKRVF